MKTLLVSLRKHQVSQRLAFEHFGETKVVDWFISKDTTYQRILDVVNNGFTPDLIFMQIQDSGVLHPRQLRSLPGIKVNWTGDVRHPIPHFYYDLAPGLDLSLFCNEHDVELFSRSFPAKFMNIGFEESIYYRDSSAQKDIRNEIVFMGNNHIGLRFPLSKLRRRMVSETAGLITYGERWNGYARGNLMDDPHREAQIYRGCKIAINLSHFDIDRYTSDRLFRIMACGAFCLSHHYTGIEKDFTPGVHLETWKNLDQLTEKIRYYLHNDEERNKIALQGWEEVSKNHTWLERVKQLRGYLGFTDGT